MGTRPTQKIFVGVWLKVTSTALFSVMSALIKLSSKTYPTSEIVFFRSLVALFVLLAWLMGRPGLFRPLRTRRFWGHIGRGLLGVGSMFCGFAALSYLPLPDATAFSYATPLVIVVLAAIVLNERVSLTRWAGILTGLLGVILILHEQLGASVSSPAQAALRTTGTILAILNILTTAFAQIQTRRLTRTEDTAAIVFYFQSTATLAAVIMMLAAAMPASVPFAGFFAPQHWVTPDMPDLLTLCALGVLGGLGQILMTQSYLHLDASVNACFDYLSLVWALLISFLLFGELPTFTVLAGAIIVASAGIFILWNESRQNRQRTYLARPR